MVLKLISSTPSPYARKVRIQLLEKNIPFELITEVPWDHTTGTPNHNPLEKLPILIFDDGRPPIYESSLILEYVEQKFEPKHSLTPKDVDEALRAKQLAVIADGICDALVLSYFENSRRERKSDEWMARQTRKIEGGVKALADIVSKMEGEFFVGGKLSLADVAVVSMIDFLRLNQHPALKPHEEVLFPYADRLDEREAFGSTKPVMFEIKDKIV